MCKAYDKYFIELTILSSQQPSKDIFHILKIWRLILSKDKRVAKEVCLVPGISQTWG